MIDDDSLSDREYYEAMPIEELGREGCCKIFCREYLRISPEAELWGVKRSDGSLAHVFIIHDGTAYDVRGAIELSQMKEDSSETVAKISSAEFNKMSTFADCEKLLADVAANRFAKVLKENSKKYGFSK